MKRLTTVTLLLISLGVACWQPAMAAIKVGFVNIAKVMAQAPQAEAARKALKQEFSGRDAKLTTKRDQIVQMEKKLQTDGEIMSASQRENLQYDIDRRKREFNRSRDDLKEDFNIRRNEELSKLQHEVNEVIVKIAKEKDYDLLVTEQVLFASKSIDITDLVISELKKK